LWIIIIMADDLLDNDVDRNKEHLISLIAKSSVARNECFDPSQRITIRVMLGAEWLQATRGLAVSPTCSDAWFERLWNLHAEPWRHYHTAVHLEEMVQYLGLVQGATQYLSSLSQQDDQTIRLSIFFHDAIYDPKSATNEEDSAQLFQSFADQAGLATTHPSLVTNVNQYILATKKHVVSSDNSFPLAFFLDLDMAVLGKQEAAYQSYAALIRKEYSFVDRDEYCSKRAQVLEQFLAQDQIYGTILFQQSLEEQARRNLALEIAALKNGVIYGESQG
jgi:predicted metal-dependent HD superfamily phosphohydrolase